LFKGIRVPYKSLLKLLLFECFVVDFPQVRWLAEEAHARYHDTQDISAVDVDPYLLMMRRIEKHLAQNGETQRLLLARRALYLKSGVRLSRSQEDWKTPIFRQLCEEWGWDEGEIINLDGYHGWKLPRVIEERNNLVGELSRSYRLLTTLARERDELHQIDMRDLSLLGRKLFSSLERRPGKVDLVNPGISVDLHQREIWVRRHRETRAWQCFLSYPEEDAVPVKTAAGIVELIAWLTANGVIDHSTRIDLPETQSGAAEKEHLHILKALRRHFSAQSRQSAPLGEFARPALGNHALAVVNAMQPIQSHPDGLLLVSQRADPLSFGTRRHNLMAQIDYVHDNNWGELHVAQYVGSSGLLDMLCRHLDLFHHQARAGTLNCLCNTPGHAAAIVNRITRLADRLLAHFQRHGNESRYILQIGEDFWAISRQRGLFVHHPVGPLEDLMDYLGETDGRFRSSELDAAELQDASLPLVLRLNRPGRVQICYQVEARGIRSFLLDPEGAMIQQWLPNAREAHFLAQQQRFFDTLQDWQHPLTNSGEELSLEFMRLDTWNDKWRVQKVSPPAKDQREHTELILTTGPRGPWLDGFSLLSGEREFNSVALGERVYQEAAAYLTGLRRGSEPYPLYLSGVVPSEIPGESALSLVDLMRFKVRIEQRLNKAAASD
jgi:adenylate cyclase class 1